MAAIIAARPLPGCLPAACRSAAGPNSDACLACNPLRCVPPCPGVPQSVDVRRGRLVALIESFVQMLGSAIESLLNKVGWLSVQQAWWVV